MKNYNLNLTALEVCDLMEILLMADREDLELNNLQNNHLIILKKVEHLDNKAHENHSLRKLKEKRLQLKLQLKKDDFPSMPLTKHGEKIE